jgi:hypothetical protein
VTARCAAVVELLRSALDAADRLDPPDRDELYRALVADMRSRRPESVSPLSLGLGPPTVLIRDPRGRRPVGY